MTLPTTFGEEDTGEGGEEPSEEPYLFLVLEAAQPLAGGAAYALSRVKSVHIGRAEQRDARHDGPTRLHLGVADGWMSRNHVLIERVLTQWVFKDQGSSNGTRHNGERAAHGALRDGDVLEVGHTFFVFREALETSTEANALTHAALSSLRPDLSLEYRKLARVAASPLEVLLLGESGSGKEVAARAVHQLSKRTGPFVAVNCGAIAAELLESELFGAERGAYTGATEKRLGLVRTADKGTLFLDEIGDMPLPVQVALLRVLEQREVLPVGSSRAVPVDFRLVAATHRDLRALVTTGAFRADLMARVAGFEFPLWSVRERREDLGFLIASLLPSIERGRSLTFSVEAARALLHYDFPLNVRELQKCLALAAVLAPSGRVELAHLPEEVRRPRESGAAKVAPTDADKGVSPRDHARRARLVELLDVHAGNVSHVARELGKARTQVQRWLIRYGIDPVQYRR